MSGLTVKVILLKHWNGFPAGHTFETMPRGQARLLEQRKIARIPKKRKRKNAKPVNNAG